MRRRVARWIQWAVNEWMARWMMRRFRKTLVRCEACHRWVAEAFLMPIPGEAGGIELRCEPCRRDWHLAIQDYYRTRAADAAAARFDLERRGATPPPVPSPSMGEGWGEGEQREAA